MHVLNRFGLSLLEWQPCIFRMALGVEIPYLVILHGPSLPDIGVVNVSSTFRHNFDTK